MFQLILTLKDYFFNPTETLVQQIQKAKNIGNMPCAYSPSLFHFYTFLCLFLQKRGGNIGIRPGHGVY